MPIVIRRSQRQRRLVGTGGEVDGVAGQIIRMHPTRAGRSWRAGDALCASWASEPEHRPRAGSYRGGGTWPSDPVGACLQAMLLALHEEASPARLPTVPPR